VEGKEGIGRASNRHFVVADWENGKQRRDPPLHGRVLFSAVKEWRPLRSFFIKFGFICWSIRSDTSMRNYTENWTSEGTRGCFRRQQYIRIRCLWVVARQLVKIHRRFGTSSPSHHLRSSRIYREMESDARKGLEGTGSKCSALQSTSIRNEQTVWRRTQSILHIAESSRPSHLLWLLIYWCEELVP
jgi:hypothetical protein